VSCGVFFNILYSPFFISVQATKLDRQRATQANCYRAENTSSCQTQNITKNLRVSVGQPFASVRLVELTLPLGAALDVH